MTDETPAGGSTRAGADVPDTLADPESAVNTDLTSAVDAEDFDEDRLGVDPLEEGVDPPEGWAAADREGVTAREQAEGESLDHRLAAERPDTGERYGERGAQAFPAPDPDLRADVRSDTGRPGAAEGQEAAPAGPGDPALSSAESDLPAPEGAGASTGDPGKAQHQVPTGGEDRHQDRGVVDPDGGPGPTGPLPDPDAELPADDVPTAEETIETRDDPGEEYR